MTFKKINKMESNEQILFSNFFGSVTDKRVILNYKGGSEDLPLGQISSVSFQHSRNYFFSIGGFAMSIIIFAFIIISIDSLGGAEVLVILPFVIVTFLFGIFHWKGHYNIQISAGGKDRKPLRAKMSKMKEGLEFTEAVKRAVIK